MLRQTDQPFTVAERFPRESRRIVTVLFADLVGYTDLIESTSEQTEQVRGLLGQCFDLLARIVEDHGGTVEKFIGDAVCALFGAPTVHEDDPERALRCALSMRDAVEVFQPTEEALECIGLAIRIGVSTGHVVGGTVQRGGERQYSVTGDAVNTAARLQSAAGTGQIFVSGATETLVRSSFEFESLGGMKLKGKRQPVDAFRLIGPIQAEPNRYAADLVDREVEMEHLLYCLGLARRGTPQVVEIVGEAGIGKSALLSAFSRRIEEQAIVALASCPLLGSTPLMPFQAIASALISTPSASDLLEPSRGEIRLVEEARARLTELAAGAPAIDGPDDLVHLASHMRLLIIEHAKSRPVAVLLEDLQRADPQSLELWRLLAGSPWTGHLLLGWTRRSGEDPQVEPEISSSFTRIVVGPLPPSAGRELLALRLEGTELSDELSRLVLERSGGNALYIEAMTRNLIESRASTSDMEVASSLEVPGTVHGLIQARLDSMPEAQRLLLQEAAVIGNEFDVELIQRVDLFGIDVGPALIAATRTGMIEQTGPSLYRFRHALTQEVAYTTMLETLRSELHREIADALSEMRADRFVELAPTIADHYAKSGDVDRAVDVLVQAGQPPG
ncbi:MAG TPA: adenylate/guanylate cyclase domain-containing protein [Chloroflexota bacterium]|nr:adenylate/guanylate cyclase domain-containing protein [Chloroflexota bacterium]